MQHAKSVYLAHWNPEEFPRPEPENRDRIRAFIKYAFIDGRWKARPTNPQPPPELKQSQPEPQSIAKSADDLLISWGDSPSTSLISPATLPQQSQPQLQPKSQPQSQPQPSSNAQQKDPFAALNFLQAQPESQPQVEISQPTPTQQTPSQLPSPYSQPSAVTNNSPQHSPYHVQRSPAQPVSSHNYNVTASSSSQQAQLFHQPQTLNLAPRTFP